MQQLFDIEYIEYDLVNFIKEAEEKFERNLKLDESKATNEEDSFWKDIPHSHLLHKLTNVTWSKFVTSHQRVLIAIYREGCPNCKSLRKDLAECARNIKKQKIRAELAVIDSDKYADDIYYLWVREMGVPTLFWFENGKKQFEYMRSRTAQDLLTFIKNPKKPEVKKLYPDWSMQESAEDIFHLEDERFEAYANDQNAMMVLFYSPSCLASFQTRAAYEEAATRLDSEKPDVTMAAVNIIKAPRLKAKYGIASYPYFAYFDNGKFKYRYHGKTDAPSIVSFMKKPKFMDKPTAEKTWSETKTNVTFLEKTSFFEFVKAQKDVMVMFYTKWCSHCMRFKPAFTKAADILKSKSSNGINLAAIDGEDSKILLERYKVTGFPTLLYFKGGKYIEAYQGKRTADAVVKYMLDAKEQSARKNLSGEDRNEIAQSKPLEVTILTPSNMSKFLQENDETMVMFYAPWCGACKKAKGPYYQAAVEASEDIPDVRVAIFDAAKYVNFAKTFEITGYPTFWFFEGENKKFQYFGSINKRSFLNFLSDPQEQEKPKSSKSTVQWISEVSQVQHLHKDNFEKFVKRHQDVMVFFYVNVCEICLQQIKPEYVKAAEELFNFSPSRIGMAAVNAGPEKSLSFKYKVNSFPTLLYFNKGIMRYRYHGSWKSEKLVKFMKNPREDLAKKIKPMSWQDMDAAEHGHVAHLGNSTYNNFTQSHRCAVILFHSLYYGSNKPAREYLRKAADILYEKRDIGFGAVDCHRQPEQGLVCYHLSIRKFPSYKYYENGKFVSEIPVENPEKLVQFLEAKIKVYKIKESDFDEKDEL